MSDDVTDFSAYSHSQLRQMVEALNSGDVMSASDPWRRAASTLKQIRTSLDTASGDATQKWQGATSDAFYGAMTKLASNVNNTAAYANDAANTLQMMSEAIDQAKHDMPEEPGFWEQVGNGISDTVQNTLGTGDDSTKTPIADQRKAEAVKVLQTLANKYRTAVPVLKPPPIPNLDTPDTPPPDPTAAAALSAFVMGAGTGAIGGYMTAPETQKAVTRAVTESAPAPAPRQASSTAPAGPTDSGIKGGVANAAPKAPKSVAVGGGTPPVTSAAPPQALASPPAMPTSGTALDHTALVGQNPMIATGGAPSALPGGGTGPTSPGPMPVGLGTGAGQNPFMSGRGSRGAFDEPLTPRGGRPTAGSTAREGVFTGEEEPVAGAGGRGVGRAPGLGEEPGMPGGRGGAGLRGGAAGRRRFGSVEEPEPTGGSARGSAREEAFTEGGTGLGGRRRVGAEPVGEAGEEGTGLLPGGARDARRKKKRTGKRADYLVEDEETWVSDEGANPDVVE